jgi:hypothetical protein
LGAAQVADRERLQTAVAGRRFRVEVPLGCGSAVSFRSGASGHWWYDESDHAIRLQALPDIWASAESHQLKSMKVFWITRPRRAPSDCPTGVFGTLSPASAQQVGATPRIGLATVSRTSRRSGPSAEWNWYTAAFSATPAQLTELAPNLRLLIEGAVDSDPQDGVTVCNGSFGRSSPDCAIASRIDRVAFVNAKSGALLAQWKPSSTN